MQVKSQDVSEEHFMIEPMKLKKIEQVFQI